MVIRATPIVFIGNYSTGLRKETRQELTGYGISMEVIREVEKGQALAEPGAPQYPVIIIDFSLDHAPSLIETLRSDQSPNRGAHIIYLTVYGGSQTPHTLDILKAGADEQIRLEYGLAERVNELLIHAQ